jgi:formylglycine-generating enzyme required for sulfatase activity
MMILCFLLFWGGAQAADCPEPPGRILVKTEPRQAEIRVDGKKLGDESPIATPRLCPGVHELEVEAADYWPATARVEVPSDTLVTQTVVLDPDFAPRMVPIEAGCFQMGSPEDEAGRDDDERRHQVCIEEDYYIGATEVTRGAFARFVEATGYETEAESGGGLFDSDRGCLIWTGSDWEEESGLSWRDPGFDQGPTEPAVCVSWNDAVAYAEWLSEETGKDYRLPTEAEWEYAARAGTDTLFWWGDQDPVCRKGARKGAKFDDNGRCDDPGTEPVKSYQANPWGLYEVHGNVWEWTCSAYDSDYDGSEMRCQTSGGARRVGRGGGWGNLPRYLRAAYRLPNSPASRYDDLGFRLARTP